MLTLPLRSGWWPQAPQWPSKTVEERNGASRARRPAARRRSLAPARATTQGMCMSVQLDTAVARARPRSPVASIFTAAKGSEIQRQLTGKHSRCTWLRQATFSDSMGFAERRHEGVPGPQKFERLPVRGEKGGGPNQRFAKCGRGRPTLASDSAVLPRSAGSGVVLFKAPDARAAHRRRRSTEGVRHDWRRRAATPASCPRERGPKLQESTFGTAV